ncbi:aminotransferase class I/II-fold pyridoxal phosphate-dependent enzyme [Actinospica robiniae]|uniref:aminotransferase class I/II-fold pyridoxal phosphate-dependent enzyme n=1 Tax=Actinospica robiniae TaxID=304901 RepID=UPI00040B41F0|nr:aminotransferase class I/II-fold pyridoxal phosphate-dependent enzyme [Actinospica robiniae]
MSLLTLADYELAARARLPREVWDFVAGGALDERTLAANLDAFDRVRLLPRVLAGAGAADTATRVLGRTWAAPIAVAPCAYHALVHPDAEPATVRAAGEAGVPLVLSTFSSSTFKEVQAAAVDAGGMLWQQLYCFRDRAVTERLVRDAQDAGIEAFVLTVDAPHLGRRLRDLRNGFRVPQAIRAANLNFTQGPDTDSPAEHARAAHDPGVDWAVLDWLRTISDLPILLKGILTASAAARAVEAGADGVIVSNHGGRQLDGAPATLEALPAVAAAVARRVPVLLDGGVRRGVDVLAALALGADGVLVGRPVLHGLAVDGSVGARDVMALLTEDLRDAMTLAGVARVADTLPSVDNRPDTLVDTQQLRPLPIPVSGPAPAVAAPSARSTPALPLRRSALHASLSDPNLETMAFLNEITDRHPDAVSFAPGRPYEGFFEVEDVFVAMRGYLEHLEASGRTPRAVRTALYQYGSSAGLIRDLIAQSLRADEGMDVAPESIVVTVGAQEGMILALRALFAEPEDVLLVCTPCYVGIIGAAKLLDIRVVTVPERAAGLDPADVADAIARARGEGLRPRALYLVPDHSNPSGSTLSLPDRERLLEIAREHTLPILEDSPYRLVSPGERLPTLKAVEMARAPRDRVVVHIGSFAKSVFPGARVGYVVADQPVDGAGLLAGELARIKSMVTVNTPTLSQAAVGGMLLACDGRLSALNQRAAELYGGNLRLLLNELRAHFPPGPGAPTWNEPSGGFFLKLGVPFAADNAALARSAERYGVLWTPMAYFYPDGGGERELRLSFSALTPEQIREGVARLARFVTAQTS